MSEKTIIEVNGVKIEVDMRTARRIEEIRVGDRVKLLSTSDYGGNKVFPGIVVGFEPFKEMPTIVVAYIETDWSSASMKFAYINSKSKNFDLVVAADDDWSVDRDTILKQFERQIAVKRREIEAIEEQQRYFETNFRAFWKGVVAEPVG